MDNIIPQTFNDKINVLFTHINNIYKTLADLTANYFVIDDINNNVSITANTFTIDVSENKINLGNDTSPDVCLLYNNLDTGCPDGTLSLSNDKIILF